VGYDDYSDLKLAGGGTAGPIWAEFMKRAVRLPQYSNVTDFAPPEGVVTIALDKNTNLLATPSCPENYNSVFIEGSEPRETCDRGDQHNVFQKLFGGPAPQEPSVNQPAKVIPPNQTATRRISTPESAEKPPAPPPGQAPTGEQKKKGFWGKLFGGDKQQ
jgi:penicillin-binding protein 1B